MTYMGSKEKIADEIVTLLTKFRKPGQLYWEPFLGSASTFCRMSGPKLGTDAMTSLVMLWNSVIQDTFIEPETVSKDTYLKYMADEEPSALKAYIGFFWSFSGMYHKGYSPEHFEGSKSFYSMQQRAKLMRDSNTIIASCDFLKPDIKNALVYCDPPYRDTTPYKGVPAFDHQEFFYWCHRQKNKNNNTIIVSEYHMPDPFTLIHEFPFRTIMATVHRDQVKAEKLYIL